MKMFCRLSTNIQSKGVIGSMETIIFAIVMGAWINLLFLFIGIIIGEIHAKRVYKRKCHNNDCDCNNSIMFDNSNNSMVGTDNR